jgi:hypothetical protein
VDYDALSSSWGCVWRRVAVARAWEARNAGLVRKKLESDQDLQRMLEFRLPHPPNLIHLPDLSTVGAPRTHRVALSTRLAAKSTTLPQGAAWLDWTILEAQYPTPSSSSSHAKRRRVQIEDRGKAHVVFARPIRCYTSSSEACRRVRAAVKVIHDPRPPTRHRTIPVGKIAWNGLKTRLSSISCAEVSGYDFP